MALEFHATTILTVRRDDQLAMGGDGQVTLGQSVVKADAVKIRRLQDGRVLCGFAGASADAFVTAVYAARGQRVAKGMLLMELRQPDL